MTNESVFPKIAGDVLYASEVNRFAGASQRLAGGSKVVLGSTSVGVNVGSFSIPVGSLIANDLFKFDVSFITSNGGANCSGTFILSGTQGNVSMGLGGTVAGGFGTNICMFVASGPSANDGGVAWRTTINSNHSVIGEYSSTTFRPEDSILWGIIKASQDATTGSLTVRYNAYKCRQSI